MERTETTGILTVGDQTTTSIAQRIDRAGNGFELPFFLGANEDLSLRWLRNLRLPVYNQSARFI